MDDHGKKLKYSCGCGKEFILEDSLYWKHTVNCEHSKLIEDMDYVKCRLCTYKARTLIKHLKRQHSLSKDEYGYEVVATACLKKQSEAGKINGAGHGEAKSKGIMASDSARSARSKNLASINKRQERCEQSSEVAKQTSSRQDILGARAEKLARWRKSNPDDFYKKCTSIMIGMLQSKPEKKLFEQLSAFIPNLKRNQRIYSINFSTLSHRRQIDMLDKEQKLVIEFDGPVHFKPLFGDEAYAKIKKCDLELNNVLVDMGYKVIRVSYDEYVKKAFSDTCIANIIDLVKSLEAKLHLIGKSYVENYLS